MSHGREFRGTTVGDGPLFTLEPRRVLSVSWSEKGITVELGETRDSTQVSLFLNENLLSYNSTIIES